MKSLIYSIQQYPCIVCPLLSSSYFVGRETQLIVFPNIRHENRKNLLVKIFFNQIASGAWTMPYPIAAVI